MDFKNAFNSFAKTGTALNRNVNKIIGKDVFKDIKEIEPPREYVPYENFPKYPNPEPAQWSVLTGEDKCFSLQGNTLAFSKNFDICVKYRKLFRDTAEYYATRFKFNYLNCVQDFDTLVHYFSDMYLEGLTPMIQRAYSLLLPFGVFTVNMDSFLKSHTNRYRRAIHSYEIMSGVEKAKNQQAEQAGNQLGNAIHMQGGGFGMKGAVKGIAKAEAFNAGLGMLGRFVAHQNQMSQEEKAKVYAAFKQDVFFSEVFSDYYYTYFTLVQTLSDNGVIEPIKTASSQEFETMLTNLKNPMFPQDRLAESVVKMIKMYPFSRETVSLLNDKFAQSEEAAQIINYLAP